MTGHCEKWPKMAGYFPHTLVGQREWARCVAFAIALGYRVAGGATLGAGLWGVTEKGWA
jgi:hypothetical protein